MYRTLCCLVLVSAAFGCGASHAPRQSENVAVTASAPDAPIFPSGVAWSSRRGVWEGPSPLRRPSILWSNTLAGPVVHPITTDGKTIYAVAGGNVYALDSAGIKRWTARIQATGPVVVDPVGLLVPRRDGRVVVLEPDTGKVVLETEAIGETRSAAFSVEGTIGVVTNDGVFATSDGARHRLAQGTMTGMATDGTTVFVASRSGMMFSTDQSGILWTQKLPGPGVGHPVIGDHAIYMTYGADEDSAGGVAALAIEDGSILWTSDMRVGPSAPLSLGNLIIVPGGSGELVAMDPIHGGVRWRALGVGSFTVKPIIVGETAYAGNGDGRLHRVDLHDGGEAWAVDLEATVTGDPALVGGTIVVGLTDGRVLCLQ